MSPSSLAARGPGGSGAPGRLFTGETKMAGKSEKKMDQVGLALTAALTENKELATALKNKLQAEERLSQLRDRREHYGENLEALEAEIASQEALRVKLLEEGKPGKETDKVERGIMAYKEQLATTREWADRLDAKDIPQAMEDLKASQKVLAVVAAGIMAAHKAQLESDLLAALSEVLQKAQAWREAKKLAWKEMGINPNLILGMPRTTIFLSELAPEIRDAFGTARPGTAF